MAGFIEKLKEFKEKMVSVETVEGNLVIGKLTEIGDDYVVIENDGMRKICTIKNIIFISEQKEIKRAR